MAKHVNSVHKGTKRVLEERGVDMRSMNADQMRNVLGEFPDFKYEKSRTERSQSTGWSKKLPPTSQSDAFSSHSFRISCNYNSLSFLNFFQR